MSDLASLLVPSLRWNSTHGFRYLDDSIASALALGVGGFLIRGGPRDAVSALTADLHARSRIPLLIAAAAERGAGQEFDGCTALPPLGALGHAGAFSLSDIGRAATLTARELKQLGINWALAPVCDLDLDPGCPIIGTRSAGADPASVSALLEQWIDACQAEGVLACAKHFPGHGRAAGDSHRTLPAVRARARELAEADLVPFRAAMDAGVASVMTAHVAYPLLDRGGGPATLSAPILRDLLRGELEFDGLVVSDELQMDALRAAGPEADVAIRAIAAGCDVLLAPMDVAGVARALERAALDGTLSTERSRDAVERRDRWAGWGRPSRGRETTLGDLMWARKLADRSIHVVRGSLPRVGEALEIVEVDDDAGGTWTVPSRAHFAEALRALDVDAPVVVEPTSNTRVPVVIAAYSDVIPWKGTAGFSGPSRERIAHTIAAATAQRRESVVVLFSHPRHASQLVSAPNILCAWGGEPPMQSAAARVLARG